MDNTPTVQTTNTPIEPIIPSPPRNDLKFIIAGLVILFVGLIGGYFLVKSSSKPAQKVCTLEAKICSDGSSVGRTGPDCEFASCPQITTTPTPTPILSTESSQSAVADWKTYDNNISKYSINIPSNWIVNDTQGSFLGIPGEIVIGSQSEMHKGIWGTTIAITEISSSDRYGLDTQQQFDEWSAKKITPDSKERIFKEGDLKIDGLEAVQFIMRSTPGVDTEPYYLLITWIRKNNTNYYIELNANENTVNQYTEIYNQILSTFKFL